MEQFCGKSCRRKIEREQSSFPHCPLQYRQSLIVRLATSQAGKTKAGLKKTLMAAWYRAEAARELLWGSMLAVNRLGSVSKAKNCLPLGLQVNVHVLCEEAAKNVSAIYPTYKTNPPCPQH